MDEPTFTVECAACPHLKASGLLEGTVDWWVRNHAEINHPFWDLEVVRRNVRVDRDTRVKRID